MAAHIFNAVIGTAGHIDHGKSALVKALTGIHPDRLPEEKEKGITIDLGFAPLVLGSGERVGIIDVPGHERFIKNMVAGATGIDFVLMVIAADDGVMAQTREHLQIIRLLGVRDGLTVITKKDLVDDEYLELLKDDIRALEAGTVLEGKPMLAVSSKSGAGIPELKALLEKILPKLPRRSPDGPFRMPIQRVFAKEGFGTVVTGVPLSGSVKIGDTLDVLPPGYHGRVKGLHAYNQTIVNGQAGHSMAVNLHGPGIDKRQVERGLVAVTPGVFEPTTLIAAQFELLPGTPWPLKHRAAVRFHAGTVELQAKALLLDVDVLKPGQSGLIQVLFSEPTVLAAGDRFILRCQTPLVTLGGGRVLDVRPVKRKRLLAATLLDLHSRLQVVDDIEQFALLVIRGEIPASAEPVTLSELCAQAGLLPERARALVAKFIKAGAIVALKADACFISEPRFKLIAASVVGQLKQYIAEHPALGAIERPELKRRLERAEGAKICAYFDELLDLLKRRGVVNLEANNVLPPGGERRLEGEAAKQAERVEALLLQGGLTPPTKAEFEAQLKIPSQTLREILKFLRETGKYVEVSPEIAFHRRSVDDAKSRMRELFALGAERTTSEIRQHLGISRKYAIPLVEFLDKEKFTTFDGDKRKLVQGGRGEGVKG